MTDDQTPQDHGGPTDPFEEALAARFAGTAEPVSGAGVTRRSIDVRATAKRRAHTRRRMAVGSAAAAGVLVVGAVAAGVGTSSEPRLRTGAAESPETTMPTATVPGAPCRLVDADAATADGAAPGSTTGDVRDRAKVLQAKVQDLLDAVGPDGDSYFQEGEALFLLGSFGLESNVSPEYRRFQAAVESVDQARWDDVRRRGAAALTDEQRAAIAALEPQLPSRAEAATDQAQSQVEGSTPAGDLIAVPRGAASAGEAELVVDAGGQLWVCPVGTEAPDAERTTTTTVPMSTTTMAQVPASTTTTSTDPTTPTSSTLVPGAVEEAGTLAIPAIQVSATVRPGRGEDVLTQGLGLDPDSPPPGEVGNVVIYGHRTTYGQELRDLDDLVQGDTIELTTADGRFTYRVDGAPTEVDPEGSPEELFGPLGTGPGRLTLVAPSPMYSMEKRLVATATYVGHTP